MLKYLGLVLLILFAPSLAEAACTGGPVTWTASVDYNSVAECVSQATDGDTVNIAVGTADWTSGLTVSNKCISIIGSGIGVTIIKNSRASKPNPLIALQTKPCASGQIIRLSNLEIQPGGGNTSADSHNGQINVRGNTASLRIDHLKITVTQQLGFNIVDYVRGVIDHVTCVKNANTFCFQVEHNLWANDAAGCTGFANKPGCGDRSWASPLTRGSNDQLYFEDNTFQNIGASGITFHDCSGGAREVFRFNRFEDGTLGQHDEARGGRASRACLNFEAYRNFSYQIRTAWMTCCGIFSPAGGTGMVWDNDIERTNGAPGPNYISGWAYYRRWDQPRDHHVFGSVGKWPITQITCTAGTATVTVTSTAGVTGRHLLTNNGVPNTYRVIIEGSSVAEYNGTKSILVPASSVPGSQSQFTFPATCGGTASNMGITLKQPWDENRDSTGYRGMSQPGAGPSVYPDMVFGTPSANNLSFAYHEQSYMPWYGWNNRRDSDNSTATVTYAATNMTCDGVCAQGGIILNNRDYYNQNNSTCVAGGACTGGVGRGTTLPTTCSPGTDANRPGEGGVFFWKTNEGDWNNETSTDHAGHGQGHSLGEDGLGYRCIATNTWALDYVPADYPHYLITGGDAPVSNVLPVVSITAPATTGQYDTSTTPLTTLAGTATDVDGTISSVTWICTPSCGSESATLTLPTWSISSISVPADDVSTITITATDDDAGTHQTSIQVNHVTTAVGDTDTFNRDNWDTLGPNWVHIGSGPNYTITNNQVSNQLVTFDAARWTVSPSSADQCSQLTYISGGVTVFVRLNGTDGATLAGYAFKTSGATNTFIQEYRAGEGLVILQTVSETFVSGNIIKVCVEGTVIRAYKCTPTCSQVGTDQVDDTLSDGEVGFAIYNGAADQFVGGNLTESGNTNPVVMITSPTSNGTYETTAGSISLSGSASDDGIIISNNWSTDQGGSGSCSGGTSPVCGTIPVVASVITTVTLTTTDDADSTGSDTLQVMSIPVPGTPVDTFGRVDWPGPGPNWTCITSDCPAIVNQQLSSSSAADNYVLWNAHVLSEEQCVTAKIGSLSGVSIGAIVRASSDTGANRDLYIAKVSEINAQIIKEVNGSVVFSETLTGDPWAASDLLRLCASGSATVTLSLYRTPVAGTELLYGSIEDSDSPLASSLFGIYLNGPNNSLDDFSAEEITPVGDVTPPVVVIQTPTALPTLSTGLSPIDLSGTCTDEMGGSGVDEVTWSTNIGSSGIATGTTSWSISDIIIPTGTPTVISVVCSDIAANDSSAAVLTVTRLAGRSGKHPLRAR